MTEEDAAMNIDAQLLRAVGSQMDRHQLTCPFMWIDRKVCEEICPEKLHDLMYLAPSDWDGIVCSLVIITRGVLVDGASLRVTEQALLACLQPLESPSCPLLQDYSRAMRHVINATRVMVASLALGQDITSIPTLLCGPALSELSDAEKSAVVACKSLALQICHYALWPAFMNERNPLFAEARQAAFIAWNLNKEEGYWSVLYGRCLPFSDPQKLTLIQAGFRARKVPFTLIELANNFARSKTDYGTAVAATLLNMAVKDWPDSLFVQTNYMTMFLDVCRDRLSLLTARECLQRARAKAPDSNLLAGYAKRLRDVEHNSQLSPIVEEDGLEKLLQLKASRFNPEPVPVPASATPSPSPSLAQSVSLSPSLSSSLASLSSSPPSSAQAPSPSPTPPAAKSPPSPSVAPPSAQAPSPSPTPPAAKSPPSSSVATPPSARVPSASLLRSQYATATTNAVPVVVLPHPPPVIPRRSVNDRLRVAREQCMAKQMASNLAEVPRQVIDHATDTAILMSPASPARPSTQEARTSTAPNYSLEQILGSLPRPRKSCLEVPDLSLLGSAASAANLQDFADIIKMRGSTVPIATPPPAPSVVTSVAPPLKPSVVTSVAPLLKSSEVTSAVPLPKSQVVTSAVPLPKPQVVTSAVPLPKPSVVTSAVFLPKPQEVTSAVPLSKPSVVTSVVSPLKPSVVSSVSSLLIPSVNTSVSPLKPSVLSSVPSPLIPSVITSAAPLKSSVLSSVSSPLIPSVVTSVVSPLKPSVVSSVSSPLIPSVVTSAAPLEPSVVTSVAPPLAARRNNLCMPWATWSATTSCATIPAMTSGAPSATTPGESVTASSVSTPSATTAVCGASVTAKPVVTITTMPSAPLEVRSTSCQSAVSGNSLSPGLFPLPESPVTPPLPAAGAAMTSVAPAEPQPIQPSLRPDVTPFLPTAGAAVVPVTPAEPQPVQSGLRPEVTPSGAAVTPVTLAEAIQARLRPEVTPPLPASGAAMTNVAPAEPQPVQSSLRPEARPWTRSTTRVWDPPATKVSNQAASLRWGDCSAVTKEVHLDALMDPFSSWRKAEAVEKCNCVCCGDCAFLTHKHYGSLRPPASAPRACHRERVLLSMRRAALTTATSRNWRE